MLPPIGVSARPGSHATDVPDLVSDVHRRFSALERYCHDVGDVPTGDVEFTRLDPLVVEAIHALADTPSREMAGVLAKADALLRAPIEADFDHVDLVGTSLARDVVRLLGTTAIPIGDHHA